ncbi:WD repeat-containing protein 97 isoform X4 [Eleutherodactylus coqui]|uniref:WD repeat-containing protein 97 isoform X4 n=1 Tax=Eleutherodactylus coqui TaxID=57060 RepID=UPI0034624EBF
MQLDHDSGFQEPKLPEHKTLTERSQELWGRLRKEYRHLAIQMRRADMQPTVLVHGVQLLRRFTVPVPLLYATHISEQKSLVSVDSAGTLRLHYEDGQLRDTRQLGSPFFGLLYACQVQQYVAWNQQELLLFDSSFMLLSRSPVQQGVSSCVYHPGENLVFTGGYGGVIVWSFGHKRQGLVQQASLCQGMTDMDKVNVLTIDTKSPHVQTCNAACGTSVWEYDLSDGTLRRVRRHLHERWISSLLYSEQLHLLISGSRDGSIKAWDNAGQLVAVYLGHTGSDRMVKVWRFYLYSEESLSLCMSFYCAQQVGQMCCLDSQLFVAFHDPSSATYTLVQYCLKTGARSDHPPIHDHQDQITGLCASPELGLVASCGRDRVIRIWTEKNRLLRLLRLNASPESLSFCSSQGELLVGIHRDIYRIHLMRLLPQPYKLKIMCLAPPSAVSDLTCPPDGSNLLSFSMEDIQKLPQPCGLTHRTSVSCFHDVEKNGQKEEECRLLSTRDRELHLLQMGKLRSRKRMKGNKETRREAMEKYLQLIYQKKPGFTIPEEDNFDPEELLMASGVQEPNKIPFVPLKNNRGFFTDSALGFSIDSLPKHLQTSFLAAGVFPNSALLQLLWPMNIEETLRPIKRRNFTQLVESSGKTPEVEIEKMSKETKEMIEETTEETDDVDEIPSFLQDILALVNTKNESPPVPETSLLPLQSPPAQSYKLPKPTRPQITRLSRIPRPHPVQTKEPAISVELSPPADLVDKPYVSSASLQEDELHVKNPDMSEIPEMPQFILQFQDQSWFSLVLPQAEQPQYHEFESRLLRTFLQAGQPMCTQLLHALRTLHQQGHLKDPQQVFQTLRDAINRGGDLTVHEEQEFVWLCLHFMNDLSRDSRELIVELLVTCVQLQPSHRGRFIALFHEFGVHDPHGFIAKKCNSWDNWDETGNSRETLKQICEDWLHQWTVRLMDHLQAETTWNKESWASHGGRSMKCQKVRSLGGNRATHKDRRECLPCDVTPVDVLNYYCDVQMKRELQMLKDCEPEHGSTVLALPPIDRRRALLRLGETGLHGRQKVQTGRSFPTVRPLFRSDVFPCINLPVKKVTLSPFIGTEDIPTRTHFIGSLRQDIHRYFIVQQSYTERY